MRRLDVRFSIAIAIALLGCRTAPAPAGRPPAAHDAPPKAVLDAAGVITEQSLREAVAALSGDDLAGRGPGTEGDRATRQRLADRLDALGYAPAFGGAWEQPFAIVGLSARIPESWTFSAGAKTVELKWWDEFIAASGVQSDRVEVKDAELVFVGYGIQAPEERWDDFAGVDVRGKMLLVLNSDPHWDPELFEGARRLYYGRWTYKYESAARQGAAGAIIIHTDESAGYPWQVVQTSWSGEQLELPTEGEPRTPVHAWVTEAAARELVAAGGHELDALVKAARSPDFSPIPLGLTTSIAFPVQRTRNETANVGGVLRGSDSAVSAEHVVFTAHHDHLGVGKPAADGDAIYNGARDNASGMALALGVAEAFSRLPTPPRRSIFMLFVGAEEQGLLGSKLFVREPPMPSEKLVANINFELGNIWGSTRDVVVVGHGKTTLEDVLAPLADMQGRTVHAPADDDAGWYYRSDQLSFARAGVPAIWFHAGDDIEGKPEGWGGAQREAWISAHYHQPSDELSDTWDFASMVQDARLAFLLGWRVAQAEARPAFRPGDEFAP
jgi:Zn-dependent M28 family amino/carboxypeptidase